MAAHKSASISEMAASNQPQAVVDGQRQAGQGRDHPDAAGDHQQDTATPLATGFSGDRSMPRCYRPAQTPCDSVRP
jgi:hypothetical protein